VESVEETQEESVPPRPSSAPKQGTAPKKRTCPIMEQEDKMFSKKGSKRAKGRALLADAVSVLKDVCKQPESLPLTEPDNEEHFANYVASRMRAMGPDEKKRCEAAILKVLLDF